MITLKCPFQPQVRADIIGSAEFSASLRGDPGSGTWEDLPIIFQSGHREKLTAVTNAFFTRPGDDLDTVGIQPAHDPSSDPNLPLHGPRITFHGAAAPSCHSPPTPLLLRYNRMATEITRACPYAVSGKKRRHSSQVSNCRCQSCAHESMLESKTSCGKHHIRSRCDGYKSRRGYLWA